MLKDKDTPSWSIKKGYRRLRIATANTGGLSGHFSLTQLSTWAETNRLDIVGIQETQLFEEKEWHKGNYLFINSPCIKGEGNTRIGGVGLLIHTRFEHKIHMVQRRGHRLLRVKLKKNGRMYTALDLTVAYAPHEGYGGTEKDTFWGELNALEEEILPNMCV